jgi:orotidine 5'-phosphate decarboxylase subfamily 2
MKTYANSFLKLIASQKIQKSLYCCGLDPHGFGKEDQTSEQKIQTNLEIYGAFSSEEDLKGLWEIYYSIARSLPGLKNPSLLAKIVSEVEIYLKKAVINTMVHVCGIRVFKPQSAFYEQFGPIGMVLLSRIREYLRTLENELDEPITVLLDCKRGDISTTQEAYLRNLIGNLSDVWGIYYLPFDFDIVNVTPWMGSDVMVLKDDKGNPGLGLKLMQQGKGLISVNKTSNPSGPEYQELMTERNLTLQMCNVADLYEINKGANLETDGISTIGLVVGSTHQCDGSIRKAFPSTTLLVPGFGAQGGKFGLIMPELIPQGEHEGFGAIFSSSRGSMFAFLSKLGGSGNIANCVDDTRKAVSDFRINEKAAFEKTKIKYPF